jgi:DNA-binding HxlR family transcriptional regulator
MEKRKRIEKVNFGELPIDEYIRLYAALSDEKRLQILFAIYPNPDYEFLSFNELKRAVKLGPGTLNYHLKLLQNQGLVENVLKRHGRTISQYKLTEKGLRIVEAMMRDLR